MRQFALPLPPGTLRPARIVTGDANHTVAEALSDPALWPFGTAVLTGPRRSGKSLFAAWFAQSSTIDDRRDVLEDAHQLDEARVFHHWNRARESGTKLLITAGSPPWKITLPDLASRIGAALHLEISQPDEGLAKDLVMSLAAERGLALGPDAADYLLARAPRGWADLERLVLAIDRLSLERKTAPTMAIWRAALEELVGPEEPRLL